jgi:hypothetical protein
MFNTSLQEQHSEKYKKKTVSAMESSKNIQRKDSECGAMESSKNIQRKDSECDGVVQKYTKKRQ